MQFPAEEFFIPHYRTWGARPIFDKEWHVDSVRPLDPRAIAKGMIVPFSEKQVREGVISYGLSSYGYDLRVSDEFKIFTNVNSAIIDPKDFDERSFVTVMPIRSSSRPTRLRLPGQLNILKFLAMS